MSTQKDYVTEYKLYIKKDRLYIDSLWQGGLVDKIIYVTYNFSTGEALVHVEDVSYDVH